MGISDEDRKLFRDSIRRGWGVERGPAPEATAQRYDFPPYDYLPITKPDQVFNHFKSGVQFKLQKRLRQGKLPIEASCDLHGYTVAEAGQVLADFITQAQQQRCRKVHIIHGKGFRSEAQSPKLKAHVKRWLEDCPAVLGFCSALPLHGGTGAVYALLKHAPTRNICP